LPAAGDTYQIRFWRITGAEGGAETLVRVGGNVAAPERIVYVDPIYPPVARAAAVQGLVILEATLDEHGEVVGANVLRSVPMLDQAAIDAVLQWKYEPAVFNGEPVPLLMTVTVNFTLDRARQPAAGLSGAGVANIR
jgi:protein TonB